MRVRDLELGESSSGSISALPRTFPSTPRYATSISDLFVFISDITCAVRHPVPLPVQQLSAPAQHIECAPSLARWQGREKDKEKKRFRGHRRCGVQSEQPPNCDILAFPVLQTWRALEEVPCFSQSNPALDSVCLVPALTSLRSLVLSVQLCLPCLSLL